MNKLHIANLPTPIIKLEKLSEEVGKGIYIKRDDFTGTEISGNKVRKLEYSIQYALDHGYDAVITTGAIQSNHARSTAAVCAKVGLECHLVLRGEPHEIEGNLFLDYMLGAKISVIPSEASREEAMEELAKMLVSDGKKPFLIPVGASDAVGSHGYLHCYQEIIQQEASMEVYFDSINVAIGSGGTYAGLWYGNEQAKSNKQIIGYSVDASATEFKKVVMEIIHEMDNSVVNFDSISINDQYTGLGYARVTDEELAYYIEVATKEGVIFDPVYTGKAFRGLMKEIKHGSYATQDNILFIHTGGLQGYTKEMRERILKQMNKDLR